MGKMVDGRARSAGRRGARAQPAPGRDARSATGFFYGGMGRIFGDWDGIRVDLDAGGMRRRPWGHFSAALTSPEGHGRRRAGILEDAGPAKF